MCLSTRRRRRRIKKFLILFLKKKKWGRKISFFSTIRFDKFLEPPFTVSLFDFLFSAVSLYGIAESSSPEVARRGGVPAPPGLLTRIDIPLLLLLALVRLLPLLLPVPLPVPVSTSLLYSTNLPSTFTSTSTRTSVTSRGEAMRYGKGRHACPHLFSWYIRPVRGRVVHTPVHRCRGKVRGRRETPKRKWGVSLPRRRARELQPSSPESSSLHRT